MRNLITKVMLTLSLTIFFLTATGCVETFRKHPQYEARIQEIKKAGALPVDVRTYELTAGGMREFRDDWSESGKNNIQTALNESIQKTSLNLFYLNIDKELEDEIDEIQSLYRAVHESIYLHTYDPNNLFPHKKDNFVYSLGSIDNILKKLDADSLIFVYGSDEISSPGRKALQVTGILIGAFTGIMVVPRSGITEVSVAIVDRTGDILLFNLNRSGGSDLREQDSAFNIVSSLITTLPMKKE